MITWRGASIGSVSARAQNFVPAGLARRTCAPRPNRAASGTHAVDDFVAAHLAQVVVGAQQNDRGNGLPLARRSISFSGETRRH